MIKINTKPLREINDYQNALKCKINNSNLYKLIYRVYIYKSFYNSLNSIVTTKVYKGYFNEYSNNKPKVYKGINTNYNTMKIEVIKA